MIAIGMIVAPSLDWSDLNELFLESMLVMSWTMIIIPLLKAKICLIRSMPMCKYANMPMCQCANVPMCQCAIGCLILEDILAIVFLVILSDIGCTGQLDMFTVEGNTFIINVFVVMIVMVVMVVCVGKFVAPVFVRILFRDPSSEVLLVAIIGFLMAIYQMAYHFNFSVALGAFLAESILSRTNIIE
jgi:CPA2 family monovalent cation:H+ antiporter-2